MWKAFIARCVGLDTYHRLGSLALYNAGQSFYPHRLGVIPRLRGMFEHAGLVLLSQRHYIVDISSGSEGHLLAYEDYKTLLALLRPFLVKWGVATLEEANAVYEQAIQEMREGMVLDRQREPLFSIGVPLFTGRAVGLNEANGLLFDEFNLGM